MTIDPVRLGSALDDARTRIGDAAVRSGRPADAVQLVLAGKYVGPDAVPALLAAGVSVVGENRLQDLLAKRAAPGADGLVFDFIGSLQRRKVRDVLPAVRLIHSVDRISVLEEIGARAEGPVRVLLQVNIAEEPTKQGFIPDELDGALAAAGVAGVTVGGLMALPPFAEDPEASRPWFERVRLLRDELALKWGNEHDLRDLSMGTSQDFIVAVEAGATIVRVGRGIVDQGRMEP
ncbi:MAG: YggS family pyridoxal phosphate-dependent enzyme [Miltoncostaeaceae bacterium]